MAYAHKQESGDAVSYRITRHVASKPLLASTILSVPVHAVSSVSVLGRAGCSALCLHMHAGKRTEDHSISPLSGLQKHLSVFLKSCVNLF